MATGAGTAARSLTLGSAVNEFRGLVEELGPGRGELGEGLGRFWVENRGAVAVLEREPDAEVPFGGGTPFCV